MKPGPSALVFPAVCATILAAAGARGGTMEVEWPFLKHYDQDHLARIALPVGGIGTGTVSLGGRGDLLDWEVANRPAKGFNPGPAFFTAWLPERWGTPLLDFWDDFSEDGALHERTSDSKTPWASLAVTREIPPGGTSVLTFYIT